MPRKVGRYVLLDKLAAGGMGAVHLGRLHADGGFSKLVAIKVLHAQYAGDPEFREMFLDEARIVSRIRHANVVSTLDVIEADGELFLILEYVDGLALSSVMRDLFGRGGSVPLGVAVAIVCDALDGLHAAHEARSDTGKPQLIVHRDVSPQNIMLARDGVARIVDFGVAHAADRGHLTQPGEVKGKVAYMAPEQALGQPVGAATDVYAASIVLWELLTGQRLFAGETSAETILRQLQQIPAPPSTLRSLVPPALDAIVLRGLAKRSRDRFASAAAMARALEEAVPRANRADVAAFVAAEAASFFEARAMLVANVDVAAPSAEPDPSSLSPETTLVGQPTLPEIATKVPAERSPELARRAPRRPRGAWAWMLAPFGLVSAAVLGTRPWATAAPRAPRVPAVVLAAPSTSTLVSAPPPLSTVGHSEVAAVDAGKLPPTVGRAPSESAHRVPGGALAPPRTSTRSPVPPASAASATTAAAPLPPCCAGTIHLRFSECVDNCAR